MPGIGIIGGRFGGGSASIIVGVYSDAGHTTPITENQFGQTVYIKAVATYAAVSYLFIARLGDDLYFIDENGTGEATWIIDVPVGNIEIIVIADDEVSNSTDFTITGLLLDLFPNATYAFSHHQLRVSQTLAATVRRSSDNAVANFGFVSGEIDVAGIAAFVGVGNGFALTWEDQSGNNNNASQVIAADQPKMVSSGTVETFLGKSILVFNGTSTHMQLTASMPQPSTYFAVAKQNSLVGNQTLISSDSISARHQIGTTGGQYSLIAGNTITGGVPNINERQFTALFNGVSSQLWIDGVSVISGNAGSQTVTNPTIGTVIAPYPQNLWNGHIKTIVGYPSDQSANRAAIETIINTFSS